MGLWNVSDTPEDDIELYLVDFWSRPPVQDASCEAIKVLRGDNIDVFASRIALQREGFYL